MTEPRDMFGNDVGTGLKAFSHDFLQYQCKSQLDFMYTRKKAAGSLAFWKQKASNFLSPVPISPLHTIFAFSSHSAAADIFWGRGFKKRLHT